MWQVHVTSLFFLNEGERGERTMVHPGDAIQLVTPLSSSNCIIRRPGHSPSGVLTSEVGALWEDEQLQGLPDGTEVAQHVAQVSAILLPATLDENKAGHLHGPACGTGTGDQPQARSPGRARNRTSNEPDKHHHQHQAAQMQFYIQFK